MKTLTRLILLAKISSPLFMLYGELGIMPLKLIINNKIICFWARLISGKQRKLLYLLYELMLWDSNINGFEYNWIKTLKLY